MIIAGKPLKKALLNQHQSLLSFINWGNNCTSLIVVCYQMINVTLNSNDTTQEEPGLIIININNLSSSNHF